MLAPFSSRDADFLLLIYAACHADFLPPQGCRYRFVICAAFRMRPPLTGSLFVIFRSAVCRAEFRFFFFFFFLIFDDCGFPE